MIVTGVVAVTCEPPDDSVNQPSNEKELILIASINWSQGNHAYYDMHNFVKDPSILSISDFFVNLDVLFKSYNSLPTTLDHILRYYPNPSTWRYYDPDTGTLAVANPYGDVRANIYVYAEPL